MIGFFNINKPSGVSSAQVVAKIKHMCPKATKVGHMGTLDPMASGVLPIAVGRATRLFDLMQNKQKEYIATFKFGYSTNTLDATGEIVEKTNVLPSAKEIEAVLPSFVGEIEQIPPSFSAKNVEGTRAYKLARNGKQVVLKSCKVKIFDIQLLKELKKDEFVFKIVCGSGTYIRSLCRDIASKLGTLATMTALIRTKTGNFDIGAAKNFACITAKDIVPIDEVFDYPKITLMGDELTTLLQGKKVCFSQQNGMFFGIYDNKIQLVLKIKNGICVDKIWLR
ncbi:MAG: tRNA pseudouridine(55) synthase TruB [Clostridia bacterium]|nr:tRNA pseudouridine(55) synthase TruB [Clostridia bacterium]